MAAHQAPPSRGFSRPEHWSGLPFPSPMRESATINSSSQAVCLFLLCKSIWYTMEYYCHEKEEILSFVTTWVDLEGITLNEISQRKANTAWSHIYMEFRKMVTMTLEKEMATHSSTLAWRIPGMEEPGRLPSLGSHRVGHDWSDLAAAVAAEA